EVLVDDLQRHVPVDEGIVGEVDDPHRALSQRRHDLVLADAGGRHAHGYSSSILMACARLFFIRLNDCESRESSSSPGVGKSAPSIFPRLTSSARVASFVTGRTTMRMSMTLRA